ncbi:Mrp/NBP35 family ATP-binding protein [Pullulanibacillus sp. KACC 23026]|uniref:Mrp/NBP35 family ATP-binding protein n=1 Tax=Pullulanibacillus sp. KACC 23026 TaxID=3028315 RepID=UPI0023AE9712|nr:Mrp/NBP35 family ATP-binding protein [Pullulanibacillus sp. KACC 23026]WEG12624.1 Mrp/NBP35 family ATP-binding protein [Pullulanibacillus sp. KACC 23026]
MLTQEGVLEVLKTVNDPHLHKNIVETNAIREMKISDDFVSLKIALAKTQTAEQMKVQQEIVQKLKANGAGSVGLRFEPLTQEEVDKLGGLPDQAGGQSILGKGSKTTFIAIASGKGGVGKSTVSVNLAVALRRLGKKVGIIDADIYGFSVPDMMGIEERPKVANKRILPVERFGVKVISMGFFVEDNSPVIWRGPMLGKMLNNFFGEVDWGDLDYLLLDLPPGTGDVAMDIHSMIPQCKEIIVTTPHPTAAFVAARAGAMAVKTEHEILGVIENMSYFESKKTGEREYVFGEGGGEKLSEVLGTELLGQIPLGQPDAEAEVFAPSVYAGEHTIGKIYLEIASRIIEKL